jgi:hypothetical protein
LTRFRQPKGNSIALPRLDLSRSRSLLPGGPTVLSHVTSPPDTDGYRYSYPRSAYITILCNCLQHNCNQRLHSETGIAVHDALHKYSIGINGITTAYSGTSGWISFMRPPRWNNPAKLISDLSVLCLLSQRNSCKTSLEDESS